MPMNFNLYRRISKRYKNVKNYISKLLKKIIEERRSEEREIENFLILVIPISITLFTILKDITGQSYNIIWFYLFLLVLCWLGTKNWALIYKKFIYFIKTADWEFIFASIASISTILFVSYYKTSLS